MKDAVDRVIGVIDEIFNTLKCFAANSQRVSFPTPPAPFITIATFFISQLRLLIHAVKISINNIIP